MTPDDVQRLKNLVVGLGQCGKRLAEIQGELSNVLEVAAALLDRVDRLLAGERETTPGYTRMEERE